ncbi:uncharacterized protein KY384_000077 [Bacidia gigantensis]|uniref:uncharacterized protein n=1 Tax=Bacidia gigantensis TaxID=2732470 RepID=UPI001D042E82|nr:uncharacterized protein KY384_000077 [Bacidia gigantensis]KAG8526085.1 hypothetical protein KY384_000077 [Bacidia gigantensis]
MLLQRYRRYFFAAIAISILGAVFAYWVVITQPDKTGIFIPEQFKSSLDAWKSGKIADDAHAEFSAQLMTHNLLVGVLASTTGVAGGVPTVGILFNNGTTLGAFSAVMTQAHQHAHFWPGILPHGIAELTAIFICGGAGLLFGVALLLPRPYSRADALRIYGMDAIKLTLGTIPLFIFAGVIEGMFSHLAIPPAARYAFAGVNGVLCRNLTDSNAAERSPRETLATLRAQYPDSPFLALGQTVFWDEPVKAALRLLLDESGLGGHMTVGVHDTDYFAKAQIRRGEQGRFALLAHNDGSTRDLWSAAGEISTLFGSETFPRRQDYARYGAAFERVAKSSGKLRQEFLDEMTEAWGWRGLVYTGSRDIIVNQLPLREVGDGIMQMLDWGFANAVQQIVPGCCQDEARRVADDIMGWCQGYRAANPDRTLSDLYQFLLPKFYELLLGHAPTDISVDCTANLLRLTPETAALPRFRFVEAFLNPQTRDIAIQAYNDSLDGAEIYTLDKFGAGALPFDLILPEHGRGTLRVTPRVLFVETRQPVAIALKRPIETVAELAEVLYRKFGDSVTLVGKAVTLVSMLAQEFIFVFSEEGSLYVSRTRQMNNALAKAGVPLDMRPILRMRYDTWDALAVSETTLRPAAHLAATFDQPTLPASEFAATWRHVVAEQRALCERLAELKKPLDLMAFLQEREPDGNWAAQIRAYHDAQDCLLTLREDAAALQAQVNAYYVRLRTLGALRQSVQTAKGQHHRSMTEWTPEQEATREAFTRREREIAREKRGICANVVALKAQRWNIERGAEAVECRSRRSGIADQAESARMRLIRNALLTTEGLTHTAHRPSAWWFPLADTSGAWFRRLVDTTELYTEPLLD